MKEPLRIFVTGGAGFIGSAVCRRFVRAGAQVLNYDALTYAANLASLAEVEGEAHYRFVKGDICDRANVDAALAAFAPDAILHLAAESHVDRSITGPGEFVRTNVNGTHALLEAALGYWEKLANAEHKARFRFVHVSTDEVFGSLGERGAFSETTPYDPRSPYSASKAASDHLVSAWRHTYGLPALITNCSNNFGPYQFPEKLVPLMILNALEGADLPVYGDGGNVRDWIYVEDHAAALEAVLTRGRVGETYNIGARSERRNIDMVTLIRDLVDELAPARGVSSSIKFVADRPGHDRRYAIDSSKIESELGWAPAHSFESAMRATVQWYLDRRDWWAPLRAHKERQGLRV